MRMSTKKKDWCRLPLPIGTIRTHSGVRRIKVSMKEPKSKQWMDYARWWWIQNRGPVPEGKRVAHQDGNQLNDDPSNLILASPGDVAFLWHDRDPAGSRRNYAKCRAATATFNRMSAMIRREREWLPSKWYAVDLRRRLVHNQPCRKRHQAYAMLGLATPVAANGRGLEAAVLGWPNLPNLCAMILSELIRDGWASSADLLAKVNSLQRDFGIAPCGKGAVFSAAGTLRKAGYLLTRRGGRKLSKYHVTKSAIVDRGQPLGVVAVRGSELISKERYAGFSRSNGVRENARQAGDAA